MVLNSDILHMGHLNNTEFAAENRLRKQINGAQCQSSVACSSKRQGCLGSEEICGGRGMPDGNATATLHERIWHDNRSESKSSGQLSNLANDVVTDGNTDFDCEYHACEPFHVSPSQKCRRHQSAQTLEDTDNQQDYFYDDDEDDDSDWEPLQKHADCKKWFCTNCTTANYDNVVHCNVWHCICPFWIFCLTIKLFMISIVYADFLDPVYFI